MEMVTHALVLNFILVSTVKHIQTSARIVHAKMEEPVRQLGRLIYVFVIQDTLETTAKILIHVTIINVSTEQLVNQQELLTYVSARSTILEQIVKLIQMHALTVRVLTEVIVKLQELVQLIPAHVI